uniref:GTP cyclohydrolase I n=1 Tax=Lachnospira eligens TaxID=39485 RepID=UPI003FEEFC9B
MEKHKKIDTKAIEYHIAGILKALGDNPEREGLKDTPKRVAKMYEEVFDGMNYTNEEIADMFNKTFALDMDEEESRQIECNGQSGTSNMVVVKDIDIFSYCEHHLALMYDMKVTVAYIPNGRVIGLSKIARIADMVSKRLQLQERIGSDIADIMHMVTGAKDIAVFIEGCHSCMTARGIKKANTKTYTQTLRGRFNNESNGFVQWWNR